MTCKNCIHYAVCSMCGDKEDIRAMTFCLYFKDKSHIVELPNNQEKQREMTDNEIIKALEKITQYSGFTDDVSNALLSAIDLINRQKAEIEKLNAENMLTISERGVKMTCKDCIHYDVCCELMAQLHWKPELCRSFKDKSKFIELPYKIGDKVYRIDEYEIDKFRIDEMIITNILADTFGVIEYSVASMSALVIGETEEDLEEINIYFDYSKAEANLKELNNER